MITEKDLFDLGYIKRPSHLFGKVKNSDYIIENSGYIANLTEDGVISVSVGTPNKKNIKPIFNVTDLDKFKDWHNTYNK